MGYPFLVAVRTNRQGQHAWQFVRGSEGNATLCSTFEPFLFTQRDFTQTAITEINRDFDQGAVAVKIWKNIGERLQDVKGRYIMPDDAMFEPIYQDIAAIHKTQVAHVAESVYAFDCRFLATNDTLEYEGHKIQGLALLLPVLHKLYHDNAVQWFPGLPGSHQ